jgi:Putative porin
MNVLLRWMVLPLASATLLAQTTAQGTGGITSAVTADDIRQLREALTAQQQQIQELHQQLLQRDQQAQQQAEAIRQLQVSASDAQSKLSLLQSSNPGSAVAKVQDELNDVKRGVSSSEVKTQEEQQHISLPASTLERFRFSGDVRLRYDGTFQDYAGCLTCNPRHRERIRIRFGVDSKLNEDFTGGLYLSTGSILSPVTTNESLTNFFERKTVSWDRGFITYNPQAHKWLSLTGGKFAYTWNHTQLTLDPDLNPEGFSERLSFDLKNSFLKNVSVTGMQLIFNEVSTPNIPQGFLTGADSFAAGGQVSTTFEIGSRTTVSPSYTLLNWRNADSIAQAYVRGTLPPTSIDSILNPSATSAALDSTNANSNDTITTGSGTSRLDRFRSRFLYSDVILDTEIKTGSERFPLKLLFDYNQNLNAATSLITGTKQDKGFWIETAIGRVTNPHDFQLGYTFTRIDQDAVLAAFTESEKRAGTNVLQHRIVFNYKLAKNTTFNLTQWIGRTLNTHLANAQLAPGRSSALPDHYLNRSQIDLVLTF